jgi:hypothetical protein
MYYVEWTNADIDNMPFKKLLTEIDQDGKVMREIGLNDKNEIMHKAPSEKDNYGLFDLQIIEVKNLKNDFTKEYFDSLWTQ